MDQQSNVIDYTQYPDERGHFGIHGGRFVSETLMAALEDLEKLYFRMKDDEQFLAEFDRDLAYYVGRPSPLYYAERWSKELGGAQIYLKREDLNHTGSHKVNNTIGQALLAKLNSKLNIGRLLQLKAEAQGLTIIEDENADEVYNAQWAMNAAAVTQLLISLII